jgi:hypothetical protein
MWRGEIRYLDQCMPEWLETALKGSDFNISAIRQAVISKRHVL